MTLETLTVERDRPGSPSVAEHLGPRELNRRGIARLEGGDAAGALEDFRQATSLERDFAEAWNNSGMVRQMLGQLSEAIADFDRALAIRPAYPEALSNRGRVRQTLGDWTEALADFDRALTHASGRFAAAIWHNRGMLRQQQGEPAAALADFDRALAIHPEHAATYAARGLARKQVGDLEGALADFDRALATNPSEGLAAIYHGRGGVRVLQNDFSGALSDYDRALSIAPDQFHLYISRGNACYHKRDKRGLLDFRMAFRLDAEGAARDLVRILATDVRQHGAAVLENCTKHLRINDHDMLAYARRGLTLLLLGRDEEAAQDLARVNDMIPDMRPHLRRVIELIHEERDQTAPVKLQTLVSEPSARVRDSVFAGYDLRCG
jgi:tetratricopeptide (TPR) repeat protein